MRLDRRTATLPDQVSRTGPNSNLATAPGCGALEVGGLTRGSFIVRSAAVAGAAYGAAAAGPLVDRAIGQEPERISDVDILNFALTLEQMESTFYQEALRRLNLSGEARALTEEIEANESAHRDLLTELISDMGGEPVSGLEFDFGDALGSERSYLDQAQTFEDTGVKAYNGSAPDFTNRRFLGTAAEIVQVEARQAAMVRMLRGEPPAPLAFDETLSRGEVQDLIEPFVRAPGL
jgi:rubrerythrin